MYLRKNKFNEVNAIKNPFSDIEPKKKVLFLKIRQTQIHFSLLSLMKLFIGFINVYSMHVFICV